MIKETKENFGSVFKRFVTAARKRTNLHKLLLVIIFVLVVRIYLDSKITERARKELSIVKAIDDCCQCSNGRDFEWLRNRNYLSDFVEPFKDSALIAPRRIAINNKTVTFFVFSAPNNFLVRDTIRNTWGYNIRPNFLLGKPSDKSTMDLVTIEAKIHNDIIVEDFVDCRLNQTLKTAFALKNFLIRFNRSEFFLKIEDDVFLNVLNLREMLKTSQRDELIGLKVEGDAVDRNFENRRYVPNFLYSEPLYPAYLLGASYVIPGHLVQSIYEASMDVPFFNVEDAFFVGLIAGQTLKLKLQDNQHFIIRPFNELDLCTFSQIVTAQGFKTYKLTNLWHNLAKPIRCEKISKMLQIN